MSQALRDIPSTDRCLRALLEQDASMANVPGQILKELVVSFWNRKRLAVLNGEETASLKLENQLDELLAFVRKGLRPALRKVLNGTGIIIHTNLGRSILAQPAINAVNSAASAYCNLEMNLENGQRGSRHALVDSLICQLTGAEAAMVVNNNAAAVLLILDSLCSGGETIVSRGELVEIGGSFRIPDIMLKSGSKLREVGTTNRTHLEDYQKAISEQTRAIMRVHASNFRITGFHKAVSSKELKTLAHAHGLPLIFDLGSGSLLDFSAYGLPKEPTVREIIGEGADLVCFSGDKALGGPQAGLIAGRAHLVEKLKKNPLARALRCDKLCLAALEATLRLYLDPAKALESVPTVMMIGMGPQILAKKARSLASAIRRAFAANDIGCTVTLLKDDSRVGGGSFPEQPLPTTLVCLKPATISAEELRARLLQTSPPLVGRMERDAFCIDPRAIAREDYPSVVNALLQALN